MEVIFIPPFPRSHPIDGERQAPDSLEGQSAAFLVRGSRVRIPPGALFNRSYILLQTLVHRKW